MINSPSSTFCPLVWHQLTVMPDGLVKPCNIARPLTDSKGKHVTLVGDNREPSAVWNHDALKAVRRTMMAGHWPAQCRDCSHAESTGIPSKRQKLAESWRNQEDLKVRLQATEADGHLDHPPAALDLRLGNQCNLTCVMCYPGFSSSWSKLLPQVQKHAAQLGPGSFRFLDSLAGNPTENTQWQDDESIMPWLRGLAPTLTEVQFVGGEPLLLKNHKRILVDLTQSGDSKHITLKYHSNGTILPPDILDLWTQFQSVSLYLSIDGIGPEYSYIRTPARWETFTRNVERFLQMKRKNWNLLFIYSLQLLNCSNVVTFLKWLAKLDPHWQPNPYFDSVVWNVVGNPTCLSPQTLPENIKGAVLEKVEQELAEFWSTDPVWRELAFVQEIPTRLRNAMSYGRGFQPAPIAETMAYLKILDQIHGQDWRQVFPWLASRFEDLERGAKGEHAAPILRNQNNPEL